MTINNNRKRLFAREQSFFFGFQTLWNLFKKRKKICIHILFLLLFLFFLFLYLFVCFLVHSFSACFFMYIFVVVPHFVTFVTFLLLFTWYCYRQYAYTILVMASSARDQTPPFPSHRQSALPTRHGYSDELNR